MIESMYCAEVPLEARRVTLIDWIPFEKISIRVSHQDSGPRASRPAVGVGDSSHRCGGLGVDGHATSEWLRGMALPQLFLFALYLCTRLGLIHGARDPDRASKRLERQSKGHHGRQLRRALITGITGQDGSYLAELLISKGYEVHGIVRRASSRMVLPLEAVQLHLGDLMNSTSLRQIIAAVRPDELYNLGAQSHVQSSFDSVEMTAEVDALGVTPEPMPATPPCGPTRFFQALTLTRADLQKGRPALPLTHRVARPRPSATASLLPSHRGPSLAGALAGSATP